MLSPTLVLDDMIASRRTTTKRGVSNADKSIATARANRTAKLNAKRGLTTSAKPTAQEVKSAISKQASKVSFAAPTTTTTTPAGHRRRRATSAAATPTIAPVVKKNRRGKSNNSMEVDSPRARAARQVATKQTAAQKVRKDAPGMVMATLPRVGRPPPKKAIAAAVNAMESVGYQIPAGMQMVFSLVPTPVATVASKNNAGGGGGMIAGSTNVGQRNAAPPPRGYPTTPGPNPAAAPSGGRRNNNRRR
jgi:hypothetical protein